MLRASLPVVLTGAILTLGGFTGASRAVASKHFFNRATTCTRHRLPAYDYALHAERVSARVVAIAPAGPPTSIKHYKPDPSRGGAWWAVDVLRRDFPVLRNSIVANGVELERIGLSLYNTGQYACTGVLRFDGGPDAALLGANVVIRVRAYSGVPQHPGGLTNMRLLWETERPAWVHRGEAKSVSLLPGRPRPPCPPESRVRAPATDSWNWPREAPSKLIYQHFNEITHLEIVLEHGKDR